MVARDSVIPNTRRKEVIEIGKESWVDKDHYRVTSDDGRTSWLYKTDGWFSHCVEVTEHHGDGTTDAYKHDDSVIGQLFHGGKGAHK